MRREMILAGLLLATAAQAQDLGKAKLGDAAVPGPTVTPGQGNLPPGFYPKSPCIKPDKSGLGAAPTRTDPRDPAGQGRHEGAPTTGAGYNDRVAAYNAKANAFNDCMKIYVDKAQNDVRAIQDMVHAAVADANAH
jgi:hypothetical protein